METKETEEMRYSDETPLKENYCPFIDLTLSKIETNYISHEFIPTCILKDDIPNYRSEELHDYLFLCPFCRTQYKMITRFILGRDNVFSRYRCVSCNNPFKITFYTGMVEKDESCSWRQPDRHNTDSTGKDMSDFFHDREAKKVFDCETYYKKEGDD